MLIPFCLLLLLGREEDNKTRSVLLASKGLLLLKAALSRLDVGPAYYEDPVSTYKRKRFWLV
jgi:hypothetical protein